MARRNVTTVVVVVLLLAFVAGAVVPAINWQQVGVALEEAAVGLDESPPQLDMYGFHRPPEVQSPFWR